MFRVYMDVIVLVLIVAASFAGGFFVGRWKR